MLLRKKEERFKESEEQKEFYTSRSAFTENLVNKLCFSTACTSTS